MPGPSRRVCWLALLAAVSCGGCVFNDEEALVHRCRIVDMDTGEPMPGPVIVIRETRVSSCRLGSWSMNPPNRREYHRRAQCIQLHEGDILRQEPLKALFIPTLPWSIRNFASYRYAVLHPDYLGVEDIPDGLLDDLWDRFREEPENQHRVPGLNSVGVAKGDGVINDTVIGMKALAGATSLQICCAIESVAPVFDALPREDPKRAECLTILRGWLAVAMEPKRISQSGDAELNRLVGAKCLAVRQRLDQIEGGK